MGDPLDNLPSPTPSPEGSNSLASPPSTSPIATSTTGNAPSTAQAASTDPPADFTRWVNTALQARLGVTKLGLIPAADKKALIAKIWQDPSVQSDYVNNHANLAAGNVSSLAILENQIQSVMLGQGNDPTAAIDYTNMLQAAGVPLSLSEQAGLSGATQAVNAPVPRPFDTNKVSGYDFGQTLPVTVGGKKVDPFQAGTDYGTPAGSRIVSPFAGTVIAQTNEPSFGNIVYVQLDNGWKIGFGHVGSIAAQNGARVNPGDLIAISGANVGDSTGAVTEVTWQDPQGKYVNPHDMMDPIFQGTTFSSLGAPGAAGTGMPTVSKVLDSEYPTIKSDFQTYFGRPPSPEDVYDILQHGSSPAQWSDYIRAMPSHIDTMTQGQYYDMRQVADGVSSKVLGHPSTDSIVQELAQQQLTTPKAVQNWYNEYGVTGIPQETYQQIYKAITPTMNGIFNEPAGADPRDIKNIHDAHQGDLPEGSAQRVNG